MLVVHLLKYGFLDHTTTVKKVQPKKENLELMPHMVTVPGIEFLIEFELRQNVNKWIGSQFGVRVPNRLDDLL